MESRRHWISLSMCGAILLGVASARALFQVPAADSDPYHERVRQATASMPKVIDDWEGEDVAVPTSAQKLLRTNVVLSRKYVNKVSKQIASFLLVQCGDARDLLGHYPPVCYVSTGYTLNGQKPEDFPAGDLDTSGTTYQFSQDTLDGSKVMNVYDFMILPNGQTCADMEGVYRIARNRRMRYFGAAQIQIMTDYEMDADDRATVIKTILRGAEPVINAIREGVTQ